jgi:hypothetical protein
MSAGGNIPTQKPQASSNLGATWALILGLVSLFSLTLVLLSYVVDWDVMNGNDWVWFLLVFLAVGTGVPALCLGVIGIVEARSQPEREGMRRSVFGSISGGLVTLLVLIGIVFVASLFVWLIVNYPQG